MAADWHVSAAVAHRSSNHTVVVRPPPRAPLACPCLRSCVRITAGTMDDDEFPIEQRRAAARADTIVGAAILFASKTCTPAPENAYNTLRPDPNMVIGKHVDAQLHFLGERVNDYELSRMRAAFEKLAHAHAVNGVRVKVTQPWHRDSDEHERKRD